MKHHDVCTALSQQYNHQQDNSNIVDHIESGLLIGSFFSDCGWFYNAIEVLTKAHENGNYSYLLL